MVTNNSPPVMVNNIVTPISVTVPPAHSVYTATSPLYGIGATSISSNRLRQSCTMFHSLSELTTAAASRSFALADYGLVLTTPASGAVNVTNSPTFSWSITGGPEYVELWLYRYDAGSSSYTTPVWYARIFGGLTSATLPAALGNLALSAYSYDLYARTDFTDPDGTHRCYTRDGWNNIRFSTGPTVPP